MMYSKEQLKKIWYNMPYKEDRYWAFMTSDGKWRHSDSQYSNRKTFACYEQFEDYVNQINAHDIHVKMLISKGREWVIDVDHDETDDKRISLKNMIAHATYKKFFGDACDRIMYSGNRGVHIWLNCDMFDCNATVDVRKYYYESLLTPPKKIVKLFVQPDSLYDCFLRAFDNMWIKREITTLYPNIRLDDTAKLVKNFYPHVDRQVFVSTKQIRAPYSYNSKGKKYSCDHELLFE
ncbi:lef-1 [Matsumuraeses phaseoli granulovirus]|uniref:Lef-1 n=1 Tax=Matsumuraeses phaseoli granulovirus TaxID=2760664 RepID=A0AAE7MLE1_9BBAC|nr:lef-1 [Matsumuraeses phaseoli granulovirus]QOD40027.1 lef-1 [Matsumuraeses phaseoli granulovirus]